MGRDMAGKTTDTFDDIIDITPAPLRPVVLRLRDMLLSVDPDATIVVRLGDRAATFGIGPKKMTEGYCYIMPHARWINLGFYKGADLADPGGLLQGSGAKMRHVKIHGGEDCATPQLLALIRAAVDERKTALGRA